MTKLCECGCGNPAPIANETSARDGWVKGQPKRFIHGHAVRVRECKPETRAKLSANRLGAKHPLYGKRGDQMGNWKGDKAGYDAIHRWLRNNKERTGECEFCAKTPPPAKDGRASTHFANISGEYRRDIDDYLELCVSCHKTFDHLRMNWTPAVLAFVVGTADLYANTGVWRVTTPLPANSYFNGNDETDMTRDALRATVEKGK